MPRLIQKYYKESQEHLKLKLKVIADIPESVLDEIVQLFEPIYATKKSFIIKENEENAYMYFLHKGLVRVYYHTDDKEINHWFDSEGSFIGNLYFVVTGNPSIHSYEALENTWLLRAKHVDIGKLYRRSPEAERIAKKLWRCIM